MPFNIRDYLTYYYYSFFRSKGTPGRLSAKRIFLLVFLFFVYPIWNSYIRLGFYLDKVFFPEIIQSLDPAPIFIVGNYRSGSTFLHRLLLRDDRNTCLKAWEIYFAPAITHRKFLRLINRISRLIGNPVERFVNAFDKSLNDIYSMHKTGLFTYEQDSQLFYHIWSSYNLFAIFPFPDLSKRYIYYDQAIPKNKRIKDFTYYQSVLRRHQSLHPGKRYISKNPDFSPAVETLQEMFPNAIFINLVRPPGQTIPSTINLWASNWRAYGSPKESYPLMDILKEKTKHWYRYPQERLSKLPPDRYQVVDFNRFVNNPIKEIERVYAQFGFDLSEEYKTILEEETTNARYYMGNNHYPLLEMGLDIEELKQEYDPVLQDYNLEFPLQEEDAEPL
ncbi:MAG: sulfotransferase [Anaerolineales bacterium]|nr:sulfotransferase [Anaerolineales bacterium]